MDPRKLPHPIDWQTIQYQSFDKQKEAFDKQVDQVLTLHISIPCPTHGTDYIRFGCRHMLEGEPKYHPGIVITPTVGHFVCKDCWKLIEDRKLNYGRDIGCLCKSCLETMLIAVEMINPEKIVDLTKK